MDKKEFYNKFSLLSRNFYDNYNRLENLTKQMLAENELDFFKGIEHILGRFESTLPEFCTACENNIENLHQILLVILFLTYLHLNDNISAKRIRKLLRKKGYDEDFPTLLEKVEDFKPNDDKYHGKIITAQYDKRIEKLGKFLISDFDKVEQFIKKKWGNQIPRNIYINLVDSVGPSPFNSLLNCEAYFKVGHYKNAGFDRDTFTSYVVHEIMHFHETSYLFRIFPKYNERSSYKFFDEGYAEWIRAEYINKKKEYRIYADNCAYHMLKSNLFELNDIKDKWFKVMFDYLNCPIYETATSFTFFLEDKYGYDKLDSFWKSIPKYPQVQSWSEYLKLYFGEDLIDLMTEWKEIIINNKGSKKSISKEIITHFEIEHTDNENMVFHYTSKYPLWAGHNIFIYNDEMKLQMIDKVEKYRFQKDGHLKMKSIPSGKLNIAVCFLQYNHNFEYLLS